MFCGDRDRVTNFHMPICSGKRADIHTKMLLAQLSKTMLSTVEVCELVSLSLWVKV